VRGRAPAITQKYQIDDYVIQEMVRRCGGRLTAINYYGEVWIYDSVCPTTSTRNSIVPLYPPDSPPPAHNATAEPTRPYDPFEHKDGVQQMLARTMGACCMTSLL
jgi:hypothetical protein